MAKDARISVEKYAALLHCQNNLCVFCGNQLDAPYTLIAGSETHSVSNPAEYESHLSHIIPESEGGTWSFDNLFLSHGLCNRMQQNAPLKFWTVLINSYLTYEQIIETNRLAQTIVKSAERRAWSFEVCQTMRIALSLENVYKGFFKANRMSPKRLETIRLGAALYC